ncbi:DinB family protein [Brevibacillus borstelensis]|uniref:DinB family protein n=1 Tax=Brevibacillus borstelensis TaxID=45462 RepID=UPI00046AD7DC|nr:DinB family protein [Brevibacillus borstelensis]MCC0567336.1 DinB family protein [Brevibacillus borstelensis]MCM3472135.1 DinB family protein [Brevibacillus borstelensis]MCM3561823.1 DinB family protein [Brevibacillus borstelensis]MED1855057.1 DinB family protein [Brevibacillus borstelensis]
MEKLVFNMYDYHVWANQTIFNHLKQLPQEVYTMEMQSVFPSVSKVMSHIYMVDHCWYDILSGKSMNEALASANQLIEQAEAKSIEELDALFSDLSERYKAFFSRQDNMDQTIELDNPYAGFRKTSYAEIVLQVVNHGTYHRGNISAMLRQIGHASVMTEFALFWYAKQDE